MMLLFSHVFVPCVLSMIDSPSGTLPKELCESSHLEFLVLSGNQLTGSIPSCYTTSFPRLYGMYLHDNALSRGIPTFWNLTSLISIVLSNNNIHGSLPDSMFTLQIRDIVIEGSKLRGSIPESVCNAANLESVSVSGNRLTGTIPSCMMDMPKLTTIRAGYNEISGKLSSSIGNMDMLRVLELHANSITGVVPRALGDISSQLDRTRLDLNFLSCALPAPVLDWTMSDNFQVLSLLDGNLFDCPEQPRGVALFKFFLSGSEWTNSEGLNRADPSETGSSGCAWSRYMEPASIISVVLLLSCICTLVHWWYAPPPISARNHSTGTIQSHQRYQAFAASRDMHLLFTGVLSVAAIACLVVTPVLFFISESPFKCGYATGWTISYKKRSAPFIGATCASVALASVLALQVFWRRYLGPRDSSFSRTVHGSASARLAGESLLFSPTGRASVLTSNDQLESNDGSWRIVTPLAHTPHGSVSSYPIVSSSHVSSMSSRDAVEAPSLGTSHVAFAGLAGLLASSEEGGGSSYSKLVSEPDGTRVSSLNTTNTLTANTEAEMVHSSHTGITSLAESLWTQRRAEHRSIPMRRDRSTMFWGICAQVIAIFFFVLVPNVGLVWVLTSPSDVEIKRLVVFGITFLKVFFNTVAVPLVSRSLVNLMFPGALPDPRFRLRLNITALVTGLANVLLPWLVVLFTSNRCLYHWVYPPAPDVTHLEVTTCSSTSRITGECTSFNTEAITSTYSHPFTYSGVDCVASMLDIYPPVYVAVVVTCAVGPAVIDLALAPLLAPWLFQRGAKSAPARGALAVLRTVSFTTRVALAKANLNLDEANLQPGALTQRAVERAFGSLLFTVLIASTYGLAAPIVGFACAFAATVQLLHHRIVVSSLFDHEVSANSGALDIAACALPAGTGATLVVYAVMFWAGCFFGHVTGTPEIKAAAQGVAGVYVVSAALFYCALVRRKKLDEATDVRGSMRAKPRSFSTHHTLSRMISSVFGSSALVSAGIKLQTNDLSVNSSEPTDGTEALITTRFA